MRRGRILSIASVLACLLYCSGASAADDVFVHSFTNFAFPPQVGAFSRGAITPYNSEGSDVGVDYTNDPNTCKLSVYVYPAKTGLPEHFKKCEADVLEVHPAAKLIEEKPVHLSKGGVGYDGLYASYGFHDKFVGHREQDLLSRVVLFQRGDYFVLFRISYARTYPIATEKQIDDFMDKLEWPKGDPASGT
jgi:hypothetical protein